MIERIGISQYGKIDNNVKAEPKESPRASKASTSASTGDQIVISDAGKRAQEAVKYAQAARSAPEVDVQKLAEVEVKIKSPGYLKQLAKTVAEDIADRIIQGIDARYTG